jgi:hypothetical protein
MKTLTSFAIALFAARRSTAVVVSSRAKIPSASLSFALSMMPLICLAPEGLAVRRPSLLQQSGVPLSFQTKRHLAATSGK